MDDGAESKLLGDFFRSVRVRCDDPVLRREDVARRAGVSKTWYAWLEQGRASPSADVIERVADALELSTFERGLVRSLAAGTLRDASKARTVPEATKRVLERFDPCPAYVCNARRDVLAWNRATCDVYTDLDALPAADRNVLRILFCDGAVRERLANWEASARRAVATFSATRLAYRPTAWFDEILERVSRESREFSAWWRRQEVHESDQSRDHIDHPDVGRLVLDNVPLVQPDAPGIAVVFVTPDPKTDSFARLERLTARRR